MTRATVVHGHRRISIALLRFRRAARIACMGALGFGLAISEARSQEAPAPLEEVVVTARKRAENLQDVPISITTFSAAQLEMLSATSLKDVKNFVPNLHYADRGPLETQITIRGVGGDSRNIGIESGIGMYVDGVFIGRTSAYNIDLADIDQIEVLRGPQGTLFGKNTTGGALNVVTRKPTRDFESTASLSYGNYDAIRFKGSVSGPLSDTVSAKVTAATWDRDGYLRNLFDGSKVEDQQRRAAGAQLRFQPDSAWDVLLSGDYTSDRQRAVQSQLGSNAGFGKGFFNPDSFVVDTDQRNSISRDMYGASLSINDTLPSGITLTSISAYRDVAITVYSDIDQTPRDILRSGPFTDDATQFTEELRLTSPGHQLLDYLAGLYFYRQNADAVRNIYSNGSPLFLTSGPVDTTSFAAFTNVTLNLTSKLALTAGARGTYEKKEGSYEQRSPTAPLNKSFPELYIRNTEPSWTLSGNYRWTDQVSAYASVSDSFKSGGFNVDPLSTPVPLTAKDITFNPEFVTSYEVGVKSTLLENRLRFSAALFHSTFRDRQVPIYETIGGVPTVITRNAGRSRVNGAEAEFSVNPAQHLLVFGGLGYLDGKYTEFRNATTDGADYTGHVTENTPKWTVNFGFEYRASLGVGELVVSPQYAYVGRTYLQPDNGPFNVDKGYSLVNARAGYEAAHGRYGVYLWGRNLTNSLYKEFARQFSGSDQVLYGEPRTYGVEATVRF